MRRSRDLLPLWFIFGSILAWTPQQVHSFSAQLRRPWEFSSPDRSADDSGRSSDWDVLVLLGHRGSILELSSTSCSSSKRTSSSLLHLSLGRHHDGSSQHHGDGEHHEEGTEKAAYNNSTMAASSSSSSSSSSWPPSSSSIPSPVAPSTRRPTNPFAPLAPQQHPQFDSVSLSSLRRINGTPYVPSPTVRSSLGLLFRMTRPENFPGVVLFHMVGIRLALQRTPFASHYWRILLREPTLWITLVVLLLTSSTSMVVNDYYDAKLGRDDTSKHKPLVDGEVPLRVARTFVSYLYGAALLGLAFVPGIPTRLSVVIGLMLTYLYTQYLKPVTWWKNVVCASLIALSPLTSGSAALHLATQQNFVPQSLTIAPLWRLVSTLFFGILGREITMDCNDCDSDAHSDIRTVPVVRGQSFASGVAFVSAGLMAASATAGPVGEVLQQLRQRTIGGGAGSLFSFAAGGGGAVRRLALASLASATALRRAYQVWHTRGADKTVNDRAVQEGLLTVLVLLASFV